MEGGQSGRRVSEGKSEDGMKENWNEGGNFTFLCLIMVKFITRV